MFSYIDEDLIVEIILRQYVKSELVDEFLRVRSAYKHSPRSIHAKSVYKQKKNGIRPSILAAKQTLQTKLADLEKSKILASGFAISSEQDKTSTDIANEIRALDHYLNF